MGGSRTRRVGAVYLVTQIVTAAVALWLSKQLHVARMAATGLVLLPAVPGAYLGWAAYRADRVEAAADLTGKVKALAAAVESAEREQVAQLLGPGGHRIDLEFRHFLEPNNAAGALLRGRLTDVLAYYRQLDPQRLVITGEPGAGKTLLALHLLLALLSDPARAEGDPVPVRLSLANWDTVLPLPQWLAEQVHERFGEQGISEADARELVARRLVLPVLDGLDEMDTASTPVARRRATSALEQLNAYQASMGAAPVVLTCRTEQYAELAAMDVRMREAARIRIDPVGQGEAAAYLTARTAGPARWAVVLGTMAAAPQGTLARSLATPWRLNLAATVYEQRDPDTGDHLRDPAYLCTLASPGAVRDHLLTNFLPAAISQTPDRPGRYTLRQTHRWLARLAAHLAATGTAAGPGTDLVLHQLWPMAGPGRVRVADALSTALLAGCFAAALLAQVPIGFSPHQLTGAAGPLLVGLGAVWQAGRAEVPPPITGQLQRLRHPAQRRRVVRNLAQGLAFGLVLGLGSGLVGGYLFGLTPGLTLKLAIGAAVGLGLGIGLMAQLALELSAPATASAPRGGFAPPTDPRHLVRDDLLFGLVLTVAGAIALGLTAGLGLGLGIGLGFGVTAGLSIGLAGGMYATGGAGRRYLVFLCCARRRLPWRLGALLHWSYGAGLLRISGTAYQFRHRELQDWLTAHPEP
jgi:NACHT domain